MNFYFYTQLTISFPLANTISMNFISNSFHLKVSEFLLLGLFYFVFGLNLPLLFFSSGSGYNLFLSYTQFDLLFLYCPSITLLSFGGKIKILVRFLLWTGNCLFHRIICPLFASKNPKQYPLIIEDCGEEDVFI